MSNDKKMAAALVGQLNALIDSMNNARSVFGMKTEFGIGERDDRYVIGGLRFYKTVEPADD